MAAYVFFLAFLSLLSFPLYFLQWQFLHKKWPNQLAFRFLISCRIFLCSLKLSNTSSFLTRSVQLIFSTLLQHHISKLPRCTWYAAPKCPSFSTIQSYAPALLESSLNMIAICWLKDFSSCLMLIWPWQSWVSFHVHILHYLLSAYPNSLNILICIQVFIPSSNMEVVIFSY